jgi:hypothetical protein
MLIDSHGWSEREKLKRELHLGAISRLPIEVTFLSTTENPRQLLKQPPGATRPSRPKPPKPGWEMRGPWAAARPMQSPSG